MVDAVDTVAAAGDGDAGTGHIHHCVGSGDALDTAAAVGVEGGVHTVAVAAIVVVGVGGDDGR